MTEENEPNGKSLDTSGLITHLLMQSNIPIESVDNDAEGGVAIHLSSKNRRIWIAILNTGSVSVVFSENEDIVSKSWCEDSIKQIQKWLL